MPKKKTKQKKLKRNWVRYKFLEYLKKKFNHFLINSDKFGLADNFHQEKNKIIKELEIKKIGRKIINNEYKENNSISLVHIFFLESLIVIKFLNKIFIDIRKPIMKSAICKKGVVIIIVIGK